LPKLPKGDDGSELWWWAKFLTVESKEELAMVAKKSASLKKAADRLVSVSKDMRVRARLASQELFEMDRRVEMRLAVEKGVRKGLREGRKKGVAEGRAAGVVEGRAEGRVEIVTLIEQGVSLGDIKKMLSKEKPVKKKRS